MHSTTNDEIAFRANLLALNAAVEAAPAMQMAQLPALVAGFRPGVDTIPAASGVPAATQIRKPIASRMSPVGVWHREGFQEF